MIQQKEELKVFDMNLVLQLDQKVYYYTNILYIINNHISGS